MINNKAQRGIAVFEAIKGASVLLAGFGLLAFLHKNVQVVAESLVMHLHLSPTQHYPQVFLQLASHVGDVQIWLLAGFALLYASLRFAEAYGLWFNLRWGQWVAVISGGIYLPAELYELAIRFTGLKLLILLANIAVIMFIGYKIRHETTKRPV